MGIPFNDEYEAPMLTRKMFTNLRKTGKGFSGKVTPLFENMLVSTAKEALSSEAAGEASPPHSAQHTSSPSTSHSAGHDFHISPRRPTTPLSPRASPHSAGSPPV